MTTLTIPDLDDELQATLRKLAARHGHSVEEEARGILRQVLTQPQPPTPHWPATGPALPWGRHGPAPARAPPAPHAPAMG